MELTPSEWEEIINSQYSVQSGSGIVGYSGLSSYQRGYGFGSIVRSIFRAARPVARRLARSVAKKGVENAALIGSDVLSGQDFKTSLKSRAKAAAGQVIRGVGESIDPTGGMIPVSRSYKPVFEQEAMGPKKRRKRPQRGRGVGYKRGKKAIKRRKQVGKGRKKRRKPKKRRIKRDQLGTYFK